MPERRKYRVGSSEESLKVALTCSRIAGATAVVCMLAACGSAKPRIHAQRAAIRVETDASRPVEGAAVLVNDEAVGATHADGLTEVQVQGIAGDKFKVALKCPEGFRAATPETQEFFVTPMLAGPAPRLDFRCESTSRKAVVVVRADGGSNLPVRYLGRELARTDEHGAATVVVEASEGEPFELVLDTTLAKKLHPQNPSLTFRMGPKDESFLFDQRFTADKPKPVVRRPPHVPTRLTAPVPTY